MEEEPRLNGLSPYGKNQLLDAGWWGKLVGMTGFAFSGILALIAVLVMSGGPTINAILKPTSTGSEVDNKQFIFYGLIYLLLAAFYFLMSWWVFRFGSEVRHGLLQNNEEEIDSSFNNLKNYLQALGILTLLGLGVTAIAVLGTLTLVYFG